MRKGLFGVMLVLLLSVFIMSSGGAENTNKPILFADKNLDTSIREEIGKTNEKVEIYKEDLQDITELEIQEKGIINLSGIEILTNLTKLNLESNRITDISPLSNLNNLTMLLLEGNQIKDKSVLDNLNGASIYF